MHWNTDTDCKLHPRGAPPGSVSEKISIICKHYTTEGRSVEGISHAPANPANLLVLFTWLQRSPFGF